MNASKVIILSIFMLITFQVNQSLFSETNEEIVTRMQPHIYHDDTKDPCNISLPSIHSVFSEACSTELGEFAESDGEDDLPHLEYSGSDLSTSSADSDAIERTQTISFHQSSFLPKPQKSKHKNLKIVEQYNTLKKLISESHKMYKNKDPRISKITVTYNLNTALPKLIKKIFKFLEEEIAVGQKSVSLFRRGRKIALNEKEIIDVSRHTRKIFRKLSNISEWINANSLIKRWTKKNVMLILNDQRMRLLDIIEQFIMINQTFKDEYEFSSRLKEATDIDKKS